MELSPKQQAVNEIKNAKRILLLGHKNPDGDQLGSVLALKSALEKLGKSVEVIVSDEIASMYQFLPAISKIRSSYKHTDGKILKIDTTKIPVTGMKWQREDDSLNIYLETEKNLKFEFIEIVNGLPKPDLIIVVDTPDVQKIDKVYDLNTELFYEVPILNIDHHPGNEYFGTINLVDLTATSTAEILVSLFEALGIKIDNPDMATCLLAGILFDTQSFRGQNTTPKSLTVAAQLLAAGGRQQEIIKNFYQTDTVDLLKIWGELVQNLRKDDARNFIWTKYASTNANINSEDVFGAADDLLNKNPNAETVLILFSNTAQPEDAKAYLKGSDVLWIAELFDGNGTKTEANFAIKSKDLNDAEKIILKRLAEKWESETDEKKDLWDVVETKPQTSVEIVDLPENEKVNTPKPETNERTESRSEKEKSDAIEEALKSISQAEKDENRKEMESLKDVIDRKMTGGMRVIETVPTTDDDVFGDE